MLYHHEFTPWCFTATLEPKWRADPIAWDREAATAGVRRRVCCPEFVADIFDDHQALTGPRARLLALIADTPHLDWLIFTRHPENVVRLVEDVAAEHPTLTLAAEWLLGRPPRNVWIGAVAESELDATERVAALQAVPAAKRLLVLSPLVGPVNLFQARAILVPRIEGGDFEAVVDWVIVGGEQAPNARPLNVEWVRTIRDQCGVAKIPFFFAGWGEWASSPDKMNFDQGETWAGDRPFEQHITGHTLVRVGAELAGRLLDGVEHNETPA